MSLVSIIIPTHNRGNMILETLDSIQNQSYQDLEIIIVDDHSTDSSESTIKEYISNSKMNISYHKNTKVGACAARNLGIDLSHGDYIQFFDDDDIMFEDCIATRLDKIKNDNLDFAACNFLYFDDVTKEVCGKVINSNIPDNIVSRIYYYRLPTSSFLLTRNAIRTIGYWNETTERLQDMAYFHRVYLYGLKGAWMDVFSFKCRRHASTITKLYGNNAKIHALNCIQDEWKGKSEAVDNVITYRKRSIAAEEKKDIFKWAKFNISEFTRSPSLFISYFYRKRFVYKNKEELFHNMI